MSDEPRDPWQRTADKTLSKMIWQLLALSAEGVLLCLGWWLGETPTTKLLIPLVVALLSAVLLLLLRVSILKFRVSELERENGRLRQASPQRTDSPPQAGLSEAAVTILCLLFDVYPNGHQQPELRNLLKVAEIEVRVALQELVRLGYVSEPEYVNLTSAECIAMGFVPRYDYRISDLGAHYVKERGLR